MEKRPKMFGLLFACILSGFLFGPLVGAALVPLGLRVPYMGAAILSAIALLLAFAYASDPKDLVAQKRKKHDTINDDDDASKGRVVDEEAGGNLTRRPGSLASEDGAAEQAAMEEEEEEAAAPFHPMREPPVLLIGLQTALTTIAFPSAYK